MARIVTGSFTTFNLSTHLDPQTSDLYDLRELITTPSYTASGPKFTIDGSGNLTMTGALTVTGTIASTAGFSGALSVSGAITGASLAAGATKITAPVSVTGNVTVATTIPINSNQLGGVLLIIRGADGTGVAFSRLYLIALRISGGAAPDVSTPVLVATAGSATPTFTFSNVSGFLNVTAASNNIAYVSSFGG